jgi:predicted NBD/HSP70 family sugar kinase
MNDADMQALGGYEGGRMLYLGLGTGVGTSLIAEGAISQIALGQLPFKENKSFDDFLTKEALEEIGLDAWREAVAQAASLLKKAMLADYVLLGGSGAEKFDEVPEGCRRGGNQNAYFGGLRMWEDIGIYSTMLGRTP